MRSRTKIEIRNKARLIHCLASILEYDAENLKNDANLCHPDDLFRTIRDTKDTLQNIADTITEIEYELYLDSRNKHVPL